MSREGLRMMDAYSDEIEEVSVDNLGTYLRSVGRFPSLDEIQRLKELFKDKMMVKISELAKRTSELFEAEKDHSLEGLLGFVTTKNKVYMNELKFILSNMGESLDMETVNSFFDPLKKEGNEIELTQLSNLFYCDY